MIASKLKVVEFRELLKTGKVKVPPKSDRDDLWRLCLEHDLVEKEFVSETYYSIVKTSMMSAMTLNDKDFTKFSDRADEFVSVVSRLLRRASLMLYLHLLLLEEDNKPIINLYKQNDTYWKRWLTIGFDDCKFPDPDSKTSFEKMNDLFADPTLQNDMDELSYFDQVLCYAAITFKTAVENNSWYPLFDKLKRLTRLKLEDWDEKEINSYKVVKEIRSPFEELDLTLPITILEFVKEAKSKLMSASNTEYLGDKHAKDQDD